MESRLVERANIPFKTIPAAGIHGVSLRSLPGNVLRLVRGFFAARSILKEFKPDVLFFTGGYLAVPVAFAGMRIPTALFVPDIEPALALRTLAWFADKIAVTAKDSFKYFSHPERIIMTGYPTRTELTTWERIKARRTFGLTEAAPVVLVLGGSKGARSINNAVLANLSVLLDHTQLLHISGDLDWPVVENSRKGLSPEQAARYHAFPYLHEEMGAALAAADLAVSRAGASILGEYPLFGLPSILVPYPHAWRYQKVNADFLLHHDAAMVLEDSQLASQLVPSIKGLLQDTGRLELMRRNLKDLAHPQSALEIGRLLIELAGSRS